MQLIASKYSLFQMKNENLQMTWLNDDDSLLDTFSDLS